ncbi:helix-turn-helix domain-containing protein [Nonomuraea sp. NPDC050536]|uniref:helix-turn-helix domain-containing protein n=1 Tax=Nonomuraea sp. NPDC050536 TaxID=3364366 RepID=UPI0037C8FFE7
MRAGDRFAAGATDAQVAAEFRVSRMSANRWHRAFDAGGGEALLSKGPGGEKCKLTQAQLAGCRGRWTRGRPRTGGARINAGPWPGSRSWSGTCSGCPTP